MSAKSHSTLAAALPEEDDATAAWLELAELGSADGAATLELADSRTGAPGGCCIAAARTLQSSRTSLTARHAFDLSCRVGTPRLAAYRMRAIFRILSTLTSIPV